MDLLSHPYLLVCISLLLGTALGIYFRKLVVEGHEKNIKIQSKKIVENAIVEAEQLKKEALLQSKESAYQIKQALESELKTERVEFKEEQRQLKRKRDSLKREWDSFDRKQSDLYSSERQVKQQELDWNEKHKEIDTLVSKKHYELAQLAGISQEEAKKLLMDSLESEARMEAAKRLVKIENEMKMEADRKGKNILALAISRYAGDYVADRTVSMVPLPSDEMKGRIIGREGRNIRAIEAATGIDIIIDDTPEAVILSGFNTVRREVARLSLLQLISDGRIHPGRIEEVVEKMTQELEISMRESGEQATFDVGAHGVHVELINLLGRLKYRTSYGQNVLQHSLEVSFLCGIMASELGVDVKMAKRAGLLHDIGKAVDHEVEGSHAIIGRDLAKK